MFQEPFDFKLTSINDDHGNCSLYKNILEAIRIDDLLQEIQNLSSKDEIKRNSSSFSEWIKPGSDFVFEVDVIPDKQRLTVKERDSWKKAQFFRHERSIGAVRVIQIHSKSVRVIDAKLCVYKEYETMITENVLLHHEYEGFEEIARHSGVHKLQSLISVLACIKEIISKNSLKAIIKEAANKAFSLEEIKNLCNEVCLKDGNNYIGTIGSPSYPCRFFPTVKRIKGDLVEKTYEELSKLLGSEICKGIYKRIELQVQRSLEKEFPDLKLDKHLYNVDILTRIIRAYIYTVHLPFFAMRLAFSMVKTLLFTVDINDVVWRGSVAREIYQIVWMDKDTITHGVLPKVTDAFTRTISDLDNVLKQLCNFKQRMAQSSQQELIQEWKKREIFRSKVAYNELPKYQSVLGCIAGKVNGNPAVRVFLQHDDEEAIKYFTKNCKYPDNVHFINVSKKLKDSAVRAKNPNSVVSIDITTKNLLHEIIQEEGERIMANHSTVVGIGISRTKDVGAPCIALFCLDKQLIPFGEHELPEKIEGFPVDIREH